MRLPRKSACVFSVESFGTSSAELAPLTETALGIVNRYRAERSRRGESEPGLQAPRFAEAGPAPG